MKNETARREIESLDYYLQNHTDDYSEESHTAMMMAIKALEAQEQAIKEAYDKGYEYGVKEWFDKSTKAQTCIEDYPTCTECEHYDSEKHYCPRFCQVIRDTLAEAEDEEVIRVSKGVLKARTGRFVVYDVEWLKEHFYETEEKIYGQPKQPSEDCISRKQALDDKGLAVFHRYDDYVKMRNYLKALPSVTPQRPKGKWMEVDDETPIAYGCSECDSTVSRKYNYCPECGAEMSGGGEDEVSD